MKISNDGKKVIFCHKYENFVLVEKETVDGGSEFNQERIDILGDKIAKDIKLSDLSEDDYESLSSGGIQIANVKDKGGRAIMYFRYEEYRFKKHDNWVGLA